MVRHAVVSSFRLRSSLDMRAAAESGQVIGSPASVNRALAERLRGVLEFEPTGGAGLRQTGMTRSILVFFVAAFGASAETAPLAFDAASIKPSSSAERRSNAVVNASEAVLTNVSLRQCVEAAYGIQDPELSAPDWLDTVRFDIQAKPPAVHPGDYLQPMLKTLLEDRFQLAAHRETRTVAGYTLVIGKAGLKIRAAEPGGEPHTNTSGTRFVGTKVTIDRLDQFLSNLLDRPVVNKTGLQGLFDIDVHYVWEDPTFGASTQPSNGPTIFTALEEQLGLKLQAEKLPFEVVVVDHIERVPTAN